MQLTDEHWMAFAIKQAQKAASIGEVPIGAVLTENNDILGVACNQPIQDHDPTAHAEILVLRKAARIKNNYRLINTTLYVTLEPCLMCLGAMVNARVKRLVFGTYDKRFGAVEQLSNQIQVNHKIEITGGVLQSECADILTEFFKTKRNS